MKDLATYMISHINEKLDIIQHLCSKLSLKRILHAVQVIPNEKVMYTCQEDYEDDHDNHYRHNG